MTLGRNNCIGRRQCAERFSGQRFQAWSLHLVEWWIVVQFFGEFFAHHENIFGEPDRVVAHVGRAVERTVPEAECNDTELSD